MATKKAKQTEEVLEVQEVDQEVEVNEDVYSEEEGLNPETDPEMFDANGKELLFPNGPTVEQVEEWKSLYEGEVFLTDFDGTNIFLWRPITRAELRSIRSIQGKVDEFMREEKIVEKVLLYPEGLSALAFREMKGGIPSYLSQLVMEKSGYVANTDALKL